MPFLLGPLVFMMAYPLGLVFLKSFAVNRPGQPTIWGLEGWISAFNDATLPSALANTFFLAFVRIIITTILAIFFAWVVTRGDLLRLIYGTIFALILAIIIKEMPLGTQIIKAGLMQIRNELEEASWASGASRFSSFRRVLLPLLRPTLLAVGVIVFISSIRDIPTVIFLATYQSRTLSLLMLDYMAEANLEKAAILGIFLVLLILSFLLIGRLLGLRWIAVES